ncbi:TlpA family protein disulfide reductase [Aquimarina litoralis]|uniref:TlpA family protein disulfide reductase n=1 Tax=Aquimarina litoralis TaxID=584605 RepID=UPI001C5778D9|nr:TlpA disulfide reductase family protein [Aquimarina litoralis]MBW1294566.1 redoxin domain-containing protein [Aquimarina litoralis]
MKIQKEISIAMISLGIGVLSAVIILSLYLSKEFSTTSVTSFDQENTSGTLSDLESKKESLMPAPVIALQDHNGREIGLDSLSTEKKKILVFAQKDCEYCESFYPELDAFSKQYKNFEVVVVNYGATVDDNNQTMKEKEYGFKLLSGTEKVFADYQIQATPTTFLLDENNRIVEAAFVETKAQMEEWMFAI